jgi:tRNA pseudouridine38-40 synthase
MLFREFGDQSCHRYIISFKCDPPFIYRDTFRNEDVEFMSIYIRGQSFMLHQIRKMIGMVIAVLRGFVYKTDIQKSFESQRVNALWIRIFNGSYIQMDVPKAPGLGLLLERLHYDQYEKRFKDTHASLNDMGSELEEHMLKLRDELILSEILSSECQTQS